MGSIREAFGRVLDAMEAAGRADASSGAALPDDRQLWEVARERLIADVAAGGWRDLNGEALRAACAEFLPGVRGGWSSEQVREAYLRGWWAGAGTCGEELDYIPLRAWAAMRRWSPRWVVTALALARADGAPQDVIYDQDEETCRLNSDFGDPARHFVGGGGRVWVRYQADRVSPEALALMEHYARQYRTTGSAHAPLG